LIGCAGGWGSDFLDFRPHFRDGTRPGGDPASWGGLIYILADLTPSPQIFSAKFFGEILDLGSSP
jgi:hypothetical protein